MIERRTSDAEAEANARAASNRPLPDVNAAIGALWERFKGVAFDRLEAIEATVVAQLENRLEADQKRRAEREAHKLAGSVGTFGFAEGSRIAREIEVLLQGPLGSAETLRLSDLSVALRQVLERSSHPHGNGVVETEPPQPEAASMQADPPAVVERSARDLRPLILIVDADAEFAARIGEEAETRRLRPHGVTDAEELRAALAAEPPDVVVLDLQLGGTTERGLAVLAEVVRCAPRARTILLSATGGYEERLEVARRGGRVFLQKPTQPRRVAELAAEMLGSVDGAMRRVMVVDEDAAVLRAAVDLMRGPRLEVVTLDDPLHFWETLERTRPDVLVLSEQLTALSGAELCSVIRGDARWAGLPILFLTTSPDAAAVQRTFAAGADDLVAKPFVGPELRTRVESRLERQRLQRMLAEQDVLTGVANRRHALGGLDQLTSTAARHRQSLSIAVVDVDGLRDINAMHGDAAGDAALRRTARLLCDHARADEVVGKWDGGAFMVGMAGTDREEAVRRMRLVLEKLRSEGVRTDDGQRVSASFAAGIATWPADGHDAPALLRAAEQALRSAKREGAGMILPAGWSETGKRVTEKVDIVLVEDDVALAGLLSHTMDSRGHSTRVIADGAEAVEALCGPTPRLDARVIILDVDLPGCDGFEVLRSLARDGVTERSRVVMLTVRATEPEVVKALEMGAFDHIGKPFSVQILMQRLRRALGE